MPGVVIGGTHSGCGKTTITLGVLAALKKKGMAVQSFKAGPDFIDTGLHRMITGRPSRNLDLWMCGEEYVKACFHKHSTGVDISVVEGVMGLYDGDFSTARLADVLNLPVILIVDAYGMAESAGAIVKGFKDFANSPIHQFTNSPIKIVIFNRVGSEKHYERLQSSVSGIDVLGYLPRDLNFEIPHRHLGLTVAEENPIAEENIERLADAVLKHIDIDHIMEYWSIGVLAKKHLSITPMLQCSPPSLHHSITPVIAIAYDKAFCFYYEDNLDLLKNAGAEIVAFSPISDSNIPDNVDAIYIGGGYPELYSSELSKNTSMLESIYNWANSGKPMYAECGGLMYLSKGIHDCDGNFFKMAGVLPFETKMRKGKSRLGYREIQLKEDCILGKKEDRFRGHEFHYSEIKESGLTDNIYSVKDNRGKPVDASAYKFKNTLASYVHVHFGSNFNIAQNFINFIRQGN